MGQNRRSALGQIITGIIIIAIPFLFLNGGSGIGMHMGGSIWRWVLVLIGGASVLRGGRRLFRRWLRLRQSRPDSKQRKLEMENKILRIAKETGGKVTVAGTSLRIGSSIDETEAALNDLTVRGYANMDVSPEGKISFLFPDFEQLDES